MGGGGSRAGAGGSTGRGGAGAMAGGGGGAPAAARVRQLERELHEELLGLLVPVRAGLLLGPPPGRGPADHCNLTNKLDLRTTNK